jgi:hypothetical protein
MIDKIQYRLPRIILLSGVALVVATLASSIFLLLGGNYQSLAANKSGHTTLNAVALNAILGAPDALAARDLAQNTARGPLARGPFLKVNPAAGTIGTLITIRGFRFGSSEQVTITFQGNLIDTVTTARNGSFSIGYVVPDTATIGPALIVATGQTSHLVTSFSFSVLAVSAPNIRPRSGRPGTRVLAYGGQFTPGGVVQVNLVCQQGSCVSISLATFRAFRNGEIRGSFKIPFGTAPGVYNIVFLNVSSGETVSVSFVVNS